MQGCFFLPGFSFTNVQDLQSSREVNFFTSLYDFHLYHRYFYDSWIITAEIPPLDIVSNQTETRSHWFPSLTTKLRALNFTSLLNSAGCVGSMWAWVHGWCESIIIMGCVTSVVHKILVQVKRNNQSQNFDVGDYDSLKFYLWF